MYTRTLSFAVPLLAVLTCGCSVLPASSTPEWDRHFGMRARATLASQVLQTGPVNNADVAGMDGHKARAAYQHYQQAAGDTARSDAGQSASTK
ncbi:hypothetical protein [Duganella qianjiadongensis]|uniref:Lipoprotein n=1 Tax=Duganella qianjiadongensis TaxID=2692176 RepID=A0ABW9VQH7_9BURK|nr:hypothetical protein [Duganella qianjiadongensis]MYM40674.1 hypothetical protein [Duganella qianjiadongensis]